MNIYLITSKSLKLANEEICKIVGKNDFININLNSSSIDNFIEEASYQFFGESNKYIIVRNANFFASGKLSEADEKKVVNYLNNPSDFATVIFVNDEVDNRKKIVKLIKEKYKMISLVVDYKNVYDYINKYLINNKFKSDYKFNNYLVGLYGLNIDLIYNELDKIMLFYNDPCVIDFNKGKEIVAKPVDDNVFHFVDSVVNKKIDVSLKLLSDLKTLKIDNSYLIILLAREFRLIYYVKKMYELRYDVREILNTLKLQEWQMNKIYKESLNFTIGEVNDYLLDLANYDKQIKTGKIDKDLAMNLFLVSIIA